MMEFLVGVIVGYGMCLISDMIWTIRNASRRCSSCGIVKTDLR